MSAFNELLGHRGALIAASVVLALIIGVLTSSLFGFALFLFVPSLVLWIARR
jgi:hypothetical protein